LITFLIKRPVPLELRERFRIGPLGWGLYGLELVGQAHRKGPEYRLADGGAAPRVVTFKRGDWEEQLLTG